MDFVSSPPDVIMEVHRGSHSSAYTFTVTKSIIWSSFDLPPPALQLQEPLQLLSLQNYAILYYFCDCMLQVINEQSCTSYPLNIDGAHGLKYQR